MHHDRVSVAHVVEQFVELGPLGVLPRDLVREDSVGGDSVELAVEVLVDGADPRVYPTRAMSLGPPYLPCGVRLDSMTWVRQCQETTRSTLTGHDSCGVSDVRLGCSPSDVQTALTFARSLFEFVCHR